MIGKVCFYVFLFFKGPYLTKHLGNWNTLAFNSDSGFMARVEKDSCIKIEASPVSVLSSVELKGIDGV